MKNKISIIVLLIILIPIVAQAKDNMVWTQDNDNEHDISWDGGHSTMSYITFGSDAEHTNIAYCIDPGVSAPSVGDTCTTTHYEGSELQARLNVINNSANDKQAGYGLRFLNDAMLRANGNDNIIDAYGRVQSGDTGVTMNADAQAGLNNANNARKAAEETKKKEKEEKKKKKKEKAKTGTVTQNGNTFIYSNMPKDTQVTVSCTMCTTSKGSLNFTIQDSGSFSVKIDPNYDPSQCLDGQETVSVNIDGHGVIIEEDEEEESQGNPSEGGNGSNQGGETTEKTVCTSVARLECGDPNKPTLDYQVFEGCDAWDTITVDKDGNPVTNPGNPGKDDEPKEPKKEPIPNDYTNDFIVTLKCNGLCENAPACPSTEDFLTIPEESGDGVPDAMCDMGGVSVTFIKEATTYEEGPDEWIECCVLDNPINKTDQISRGGICGATGVYCTEDYEYHTDRTAFAIAPEDRDDITAGSYFQLANGPLTDKAEYYCYTRNDYSALKTEIAGMATAAASGIDQARTYCEQLTETNYLYDCTSTEESEDEKPESYTCNSGTSNYNCCSSDEEASYAGTVERPTGEWNKRIEHYKPIATAESSSFKLTWGWAFDHTDEEKGLSECSGSIRTTGTFNESFYGKANGKIGEFENTCLQGLGQKMQEKIDACTRDTEFQYYDGDILGVPRKLYQDTGSEKKVDIDQHNQLCDNKSGSWKCQDVTSPNEIFNYGSLKDEYTNITFGQSRSFMHANRSDAKTHTINSYVIKGTLLCNDYNTGKLMFADQCDSYCTRSADGLSATSKVPGVTCSIGWPVSYDTTQGSYEYSFVVEPIDSCLKPGTGKFNNPPDLSYKTYCIYEVNGCQDNGCSWQCDIDDIGGKCSYVPQCNDGCQFACIGVGCIYDSGSGLTLNYQPISLINPQSSFALLNSNYNGIMKVASFRNENVAASPVSNNDNSVLAAGSIASSKNWNTTKGIYTMEQEIEKNKEDIYSKEPEYRIVINSDTLGIITNYNSTKKSYLEWDRQCVTQDKDYDYVVCRSGLLSQLGISGQFISAKSIPVPGINIQRKSGTGPAWK